MNHSERAIKWYQQKQYVEAKSCLDTLILLNPVNGKYFFKRGYAKTMLLNMDRSAMEDYLKAIEYNYRNKKSAYLNIGTIYRGYGYYDSAINFYNKALELDSSDEKVKTEKNEVLEILKRE